jgi:hypothetical protein
LRVIGAAVAMFGAAGAANRADAQVIAQDFPSDIPGYAADFDLSVVTRMLLQGEAQGAEIGDFVVRPALSVIGGYNSNTLGTPNSGSGDVETKAGLKVNSDWGRDALGLSFNVDDFRYFQQPDADYTNWTVGAGGDLTLGDDTATIAYARLAEHLTATDLGVTGVITPVPFTVDDARVSYLKLFSQFSLTPSFQFDSFKFGASSGPVAVSDTALSHEVEDEALTGRYELTPGNAVVASVRTSQAQFKTIPGDGYLDVGGFAGLDFQGDGVVQFRAVAGLEQRRFDTTPVATRTSPTFEVNAVWTPTGLDTVTGTAYRQLVDPTSAFARNQIVTDGRVELDHELRTDVFLRADAELGESNSQSDAVTVGDDNETEVSLGTAAFWNINRNLRATLSYDFRRGWSTESLAAPTNRFSSLNFTRNTILLGFTVYE